MAKAYCLKCKAKRTITNAIITKTKKGVNRITGKCPKCKTTMNKMLSSSQRGKGLFDTAIKGYQKMFQDINSRIKYGRSPFAGMTKQQFVEDDNSDRSWRRWSNKYTKISNKSGHREAEKYRRWYLKKRDQKMKQFGLRGPPGAEGDDD